MGFIQENLIPFQCSFDTFCRKCYLDIREPNSIIAWHIGLTIQGIAFLTISRSCVTDNVIDTKLLVISKEIKKFIFSDVHYQSDKKCQERLLRQNRS